ncbi:MAG: L-histidine N(alpha)-methyltransferase [Proteobacteria bacterium]|nr:L-histidine N(alpha)-methyltransferase [Pseudomonadota bacterium]
MNVHIRQLATSLASADGLELFAADAIAGLAAERKRLPPKYFYDRAGSELFEEITRLDEYYPTRTEARILADNAGAIAALVPADSALVEFGAGAATKVRILLAAAAHVSAYVPVDISAEFLAGEAARLDHDIARVAVHPVAADFTRPFVLPAAIRGKPRAGFFPGSTIGNFEPHDAAAFLRQAAQVLGKGAVFIVGADLDKDAAVLRAAYNDASGVTARFNLNLLTRINRELGADFDVDAFEHVACYNRMRARIEMHLASRKRQNVKLRGLTFSFRAGETIHTENSYKFTIDSFRALAREGGWTPRAVFCDAENLFSVHVLVADAPR